MDIERRLELITREPMEEVITLDELRTLLETKVKIVAYDGFETSGFMHIGTCLERIIKLKDLLEAKVDFILFIADWFAYLNNKLGGNMELIQKTGEYFIEGWKAAARVFDVNFDKVRIQWSSKLVENPEYWELFLKISKTVTIKRTLRAVTIAGRTEAEVKQPALLIYPLMQSTDIFMLNDGKGVDICQLGMDQRKVNMLAREIAPKIGRPKPLALHHHLMAGLLGPSKMGKFDENEKIDLEISSKMSKSKPDTAIFIHDSEEEIKRKLRNAYCPAKQVENNPVMEIARYILFRKFDTIVIKREEKYGGNLEIQSYQELEKIYREGKLHPLDLKNAVAEYLNEIIAPIREHFEKNEKARELYNIVRQAAVTR